MRNLDRQNSRGEYRSNFRNEGYDSTNRDRIRCYKCREYDHFAKDCPTSKEERELEHLQQMLNLEDEQTSLKSLQQTHKTILVE